MEMLNMKYRTRIYYSNAQKELMWDRWKKGLILFRNLYLAVGIKEIPAIRIGIKAELLKTRIQSPPFDGRDTSW